MPVATLRADGERSRGIVGLLDRVVPALRADIEHVGMHLAIGLVFRLVYGLIRIADRYGIDLAGAHLKAPESELRYLRGSEGQGPAID